MPPRNWRPPTIRVCASAGLEFGQNLTRVDEVLFSDGDTTVEFGDLKWAAIRGGIADQDLLVY